MEPVIRIDRLVKSYGAVRALEGIDLEVRHGEVHGFLGPNGAGKSTTIRILLGLLRADAGTVSVLGQDPWRDTVSLHRRLAYVPGDVSLWPGMTGGEAIDLLGRLRGGLDEARRERLLERFELDPAKRGRQYSKGNRQKVAIVAALASDVELLILDEPTSGLDPLMEVVFQEEIAAEKDRGRSVLLSSHILSEAEALADRVSIIRRGRIVETGTLEDLRRRTRTTVHAVLGSTAGATEVLALLQDAHLEGHRLTGAVEQDALAALTAALAGLDLRTLPVAPPSLEDLFQRHYGDDTDSHPVTDPVTDPVTHADAASRRRHGRHRAEPGGRG